MKDKRLEQNIKRTKDFIELWYKFHQIFRSASLNNAIDEKTEMNYQSTRILVNRRYDDLMDSFGEKPIKRFIKNEPIYSIIMTEKISVMSDERRQGIEKNWKESFALLESLLKRLERKRKRIERFNTVMFVLKNGVERLK